ncbi:hypothetical protein [Hutsoniella sourekii]|uniref:hypothetical protein n=1 Tax=Hutsoniella sourekii TaxID=87650 RepID=UPI0004897D7E|nr:hypothetical protein [Hutsoniella sourekii]
MTVQIKQNNQPVETTAKVQSDGSILVQSTFIAESKQPKICISPNELGKGFTFTQANLNRGTEALDYVRPQSDETVIKKLFDNLNQIKLDFKNADDGLVSQIKATANSLTKDYTAKIQSGDGKTLNEARSYTTQTANELRTSLTKLINDGDNQTTQLINNVKRTAEGNQSTIASVSKDLDSTKQAFQSVKETSNLYERVIGSSENEVHNNISRIVMTDKVFKNEILGELVGTRPLRETGDLWAENNFKMLIESGEDTLKVENMTSSFGLTEKKVSGTKWGPNYQIIIKPPNSNRALANGLSFGRHRLKLRILPMEDIEITFGDQKRKLTRLQLFEDTIEYVGDLTDVHFKVRPLNNASQSYDKMLMIFGVNPNSKQMFDYRHTPVEEIRKNSQIKQLEDYIGLSVFGDNNALSKISINPNAVDIKSSLIHLNGDTTMNQAFIKKLFVDSMQANEVTAFMGKFNRIVANNIDVNNLAGNKTNFIQSYWNAINSRIGINGQELRASHTDGSYTIINAHGLFTQIGGTNYSTHYLTHVANIANVCHTQHRDSANGVPGLTLGYKPYYLPAPFRGKDYKVSVAPVDPHGIATRGEYSTSYMVRFVARVAQITQYMRNQGIVPVFGYATYRDTRNGRVFATPIEVQITATY